ncbi:outer membrane protein assembly factor BamE [Pseudomonas chengduensis]
MNRLLIAGFAALLISGCATSTVGTPFPAENVAQLRTGVSTTAQARALLGEPWQVQTNAAGEQLYLWQYIRSDATSGLVSTNVKTSTQQAALVFSADGRLLRVQNLINVPAPMAGN